jgi:hypothetical protein
LKNPHWFSHAALQSKAKVYYGDVYNLPAALGEFAIGVMGAVLLHCRDLLRIVEQCAKRAKSLIIVDKFHPDLNARRSAAWHRRRKISGTRGGISARSSSRNFSL